MGALGWLVEWVAFDWDSIDSKVLISVIKLQYFVQIRGGGVVLRGPQFSINYTCENFKDFFKNENFISVFWDKFCLSCFIIFFFELGFLKKETRKTAHCVPLAPLNSNKMIKKNFEKFQKNYP